MGLRRTESFIQLPGLQNEPTSFPRTSIDTKDCLSPIPYHRTLRYYKDQRERCKRNLDRTRCESFITFTSSPPSRRLAPPKPTPPQSQSAMAHCRATSPLTPNQKTLPPRPTFPRSKPAPDLYRVAITTRMRDSPEGRKILHMGPRLALSILTATRELERIVAARQKREAEAEVSMADGVLSNSWVVVPGEDWEMVDCGA
ncbi:hypothetical protein PLICRDRAFT_39792 [Plicaturopsis crispa FD-325 SS-3]|nr:hypothetical protein PLICRDRAFT_39792 [Plicaturopsis crispa FD-325 SS-3]